MPLPFEEWWRGIKWPMSVRALSKFGVERLQQFNSNLVMLIYNIKTQGKFVLGYNPVIFDRVMGLF